MRVLLDTHVFLWWLRNDTALGTRIRTIIAAMDNEIFLSAVSIWEIGIKKALGKLKAPSRLNQIVEARGFIGLPITLAHAHTAGGLARHHADPFDRMLVAQAQTENLLLASDDSKIVLYDVSTLTVR
jgi:PIN domain nuclease of toxin-antitoxin system